MPLLALWASNPEAVNDLSIEQIVATAGDGKLRDDSDCSRELRQYLSQVTTERLAAYADHCLSLPFTKSGLVLQDVVNELGRRLEYRATNGRYQGTTNTVGFDGMPTTFAKAAWVLHMLRHVLGDETFFHTLRAYVQEYHNRHVVTADFQRVGEEQSGRPLGDFFQQWIYGQGRCGYTSAGP